MGDTIVTYDTSFTCEENNKEDAKNLKGNKDKEKIIDTWNYEEDGNNHYILEEDNNHQWKRQKLYEENETQTVELVNSDYLQRNYVFKSDKEIAPDAQQVKFILPYTDITVSNDRVSYRYDSNLKPRQFVETLEKKELHLLKKKKKKKKIHFLKKKKKKKKKK